jgi:hypothetical protein
MTKAKIAERLTAAGVTFAANATIAVLTELAAANNVDLTETTPELVTVRVIGQRVSEDGEGYAKGETFETTADRAAALAGLVEIVTH